jgi:hypothetical protein
MMPKKHFFGLDIGQTTPQVVNFLQKKWTNKKNGEIVLKNTISKVTTYKVIGNKNSPKYID